MSEDVALYVLLFLTLIGGFCWGVLAENYFHFLDKKVARREE